MHKFWYHSPVRFYKSLDAFADNTNPQNTQYFGNVGKSYPLELNVLHRFLIPNDNNTVPSEDLELWCGQTQIPCVFNIVEGKLKRITFISKTEASGRLEIKSAGQTVFWSNCVRFLNSEDEYGRKFIRVITKHTYNRGLFTFDTPYDWFVTNLPAYCLGQFKVDAEINNTRSGDNRTLKPRETYLDEIVEYQFVSSGDANILTFIQAHATNNEFYIDGTKRTITEKVESDDFAIQGKLSLTNQKHNGYNITIDEGDVFDDAYFIYSDEINYNFNYSHEPEDEANSGEWFLTNLLYNNYVNVFGITYDCALKTKLTQVPVKGFLANNITNQIYTVGDFISYCDKDDLVYYPNGFNNDLGISGNFVEIFKYRIYDQQGNIGRETTHTINMTDIVVDPIDISVSITWEDGTSLNQTGTSGNIIVQMYSLIFDPLNPIVTQQWEVWNGTEWVFYADKTTDLQTINLPYELNRIRLKVVAQYGEVVYSNVLQYTRTISVNIYITDVVKDIGAGTTSYKLHVENETFVGFANMIGNKNSNTKNAFISNDFGGNLYIPAANTGETVYKSTAVTIPIGVYDCILSAKGAPISMYQDLEVQGGVSYGFTPDYYESTVYTSCLLFIPAIEA